MTTRQKLSECFDKLLAARQSEDWDKVRFYAEMVSHEANMLFLENAADEQGVRKNRCC